MRSREIGYSADPWGDAPSSLLDSDPGPIKPGQTLGARYRILNVAGRGGFGAVMVAHDERLRRDVAIKVAFDDRDVTRLLHEAEVTAHLDHPGIVAVHDVGHDPLGRPWFAMRVVRGRALSSVISDPHASRDPVVRIMRDAAEAVAHAHRRGVAHGDLSPANIMVGEHGEVQVIDWGLAERCDGAARVVRKSAAGTARYMSPERLAGAPPDRTSDVFALGVMLLELADDRRELASIADRATHRDPARRYLDAGALARDLGRLIEGRPVEAHTYRVADHLSRLWRTRRALMLTLMIASVIIVMLVTIGIGALVAERDIALAASARARAQLADNLVARASSLGAEEERGQALALAREALSIGPSSEALGVVAAYAEADLPRLVEAVPLPACRHVGTDIRGRGLWCDDGSSVAWWDDARVALGRPPRRWQGSAREVVMLGEFVLITHDDALEVLGRADGTPQPPPTSLGVRRLRPGPDEQLALAWESFYVDVIEARGGATTFTRQYLCTTEHPVTAVDCLRFSGSVMCGAACDDGRVEGVTLGGVPSEILPGNGQEIAAIAFRPGGGDLVVAYRHGGVSLVDRATGAARWLERDDAVIVTARFSPDGRRLALEDERGRHRLVSLATSDVWTPLPASVTQGGLVPVDDGLVALGAVLTRWRIDDRPSVVRAPLGVSAIALSDDGALLARGDRNGVDLIETGAGALVQRLPPPGRMVKSLAFRPGSHDLAVVTAGSGELLVVQGDTGTGARLLPGDAGDVAGYRRIGWLGSTLVAATYEGPLVLVRQWGADAAYDVVQLGAEVIDMSQGQTTAALVDRGGNVHRLYADGRLAWLGHVPRASVIAAVGDTEPLVARGSEIITLQGELIADLGAPIVDLVVASGRASSPEHAVRWVAGLLTGLVVVLDPTTPKRPVWTFAGHRERVSAVALAAGDPETLWSAGWDGRVRRYTLRPKQLDVFPRAPTL